MMGLAYAAYYAVRRLPTLSKWSRDGDTSCCGGSPLLFSLLQPSQDADALYCYSSLPIAENS